MAGFLRYVAFWSIMPICLTLFAMLMTFLLGAVAGSASRDRLPRLKRGRHTTATSMAYRT
jgi:hypothetical protein